MMTGRSVLLCLQVAKQELQNMAEGRWESRNSFGNSAGSYL